MAVTTRVIIAITVSISIIVITSFVREGYTPPCDREDNRRRDGDPCRISLRLIYLRETGEFHEKSNHHELLRKSGIVHRDCFFVFVS